MTVSLGNISFSLKSPVVIADNVLLLAAVFFFYCEFGMHNYFHGLSTFPPINGVYLLTSYIAIRSVIEPRLFLQVFSKGLGVWVILALVMLMLNYVLTWALYGNVYERIIDDIASINLTSYILLFDFMVLLALPTNLSLLRWLLPVALIFGALNNIYDITLFEDDYGYGYDFRAAGNYLNPNASAQILLMGLVISIGMVPSNLRFVYISIISIGILLTLSRGAIPILILVLLYLIIGRKFNLKAVVMGLVALSALTIIVWGSFKTTRSFDRMVEYLKYNNGIESRLAQIVNPSSTKIGIRKTVFEEHFQFYQKSPIIGNGLGSSKYFEKQYSASGHSSHFMYLHMLNEFGIPGLILLFGLPVSLFYFNTRWHFDWDVVVFGIIFLIAGIQSHNLLDAYSMLFSYAMVVAVKSKERV